MIKKKLLKTILSLYLGTTIALQSIFANAISVDIGIRTTSSQKKTMKE